MHSYNLCHILVLALILLKKSNMGRISVVVLGDIGRSPRMQYHSLSLTEAGHDVDLIGYAGSRPHHMVVDNPKINLRHLNEPPVFQGSKTAIFCGLVLKLFWQAVTLFWCLMFTVEKAQVILVQNPPGLPALFVCWMVARLRGSKFVIDWHNYTWSILKLKFGVENPLFRVVRGYEYAVGRWADDGFCVTKHMQCHLLLDESVNTARHVFYDRPLRDVFRPIDLEERHGIMKRMADISPNIFGSKDTGKTRFTEETVNGIRLLENRPALLISSTSWTEDEDFDMLFQALSIYDEKLNRDKQSRLPQLVCVVTGKGPLKDEYLKRVPEWSHVQLCTPWLEAEDYPRLLASADLGVCLHFSSSGFDLPMKAVDMLGCRVPVLALNYASIGELVKNNENGRLFKNKEELAEELIDLLKGYKEGNCELTELKARLNEEREKSKGWDWETNWNEVVAPVMLP